jgi:hypothetical protein
MTWMASCGGNPLTGRPRRRMRPHPWGYKSDSAYITLSQPKKKFSTVYESKSRVRLSPRLNLNGRIQERLAFVVI